MSVGRLDLGAPARRDPLRVLAEYLPRPLRFLAVGSLGLATDICVFTILIGYQPKNDSRDGKYRRVQVRLIQPKGFPVLRPTWRQGYYAPAQ